MFQRLSKLSFVAAVILCTSFWFPTVLAEDCLHDPIKPQNWNAQVTTGMRVRNIPCMETSTILKTVPVGEVVQVIAETDGYYQVRLQDGTEGWVGQWLVEKTDLPFESKATREPLFDIKGTAYETAIRDLASAKIISGYPDGSYQPQKSVNRAEFTKILIGGTLGEVPAKPVSKCFPDVPVTEWYAPYVCYAKAEGIISGYPDGTFGPEKTINFSESAKILVNTFALTKVTGVASPWYKPYLEALNDQKLSAPSLSTPEQVVNRGEMAEMIWRIRQN